MRMSTLLRATVLAAALAVPVAQVALADQASQQTQQASTANSTGSSDPTSTGPYSNDWLMAPPIGE